MSDSLKSSKAEINMSTMDVIYKRRAVRDYLPQAIDKMVIRTLLDAAVYAPTAIDEEPWSFAIIQNQNILDRLSESAKDLIRHGDKNSTEVKHLLPHANTPDYHAFYNASTLIVIYSKFQGQFVEADCWLAAENLMLAACSKGLGTCVIGSSVLALNTLEWKAELGIPAEMMAVVPIIIGLPAGETPPVPRKPPEIIVWK
ncbi:MAG: nitroreductase family protein [Gammaproteobacteria bacterium]|nr:nitroreductase family protein [Gammaproteobacteria bacterium]